MWHEARKQERKIRGIMVDYKKRAERRREFYEKIKQDPTQFLRLHGMPCKINLDPAVAIAAEGPGTMMPWQGDSSNMIDRFDARAHLDYIPEISVVDSISNKFKATTDREEHKCNYERYRTLVQNECAGIAEEQCLQQIAIDEMFPEIGLQKKAIEEKEKLMGKKAAIGFTYEEKGNAEPEEEDKTEEIGAGLLDSDSDSSDSLSDIDIDINVDVDELDDEQRTAMNECAEKFGMAPGEYVRMLEKDKEEVEMLKRAKEEEEEKAMYSGRKSRRERRAFIEKKLRERRDTQPSPPSYARRSSPTYQPYQRRSRSHSSSRSRSTTPEDTGRVTFITSFGEDEATSEKDAATPALTSSSKKSSELQSWKKSPQRRSRSNSSSSSSSSRSRSRSRERGRSYRSKSRSRSRSVSRDRQRRRLDRGGRYGRLLGRSSSSRSRSRSPARGRYRRSRSRSHERRRDSRSRSRSRSRSPQSRYTRPRSPIQHRARSRSRSPDRVSGNKGGSQYNINAKLKKPEMGLSKAVGSADKPKLTPQQRLKLRMQKALTKQHKADKVKEKEKKAVKRQERQEREDELREMSRKMRRRERERRDREREERERERSRSNRSRSPSSSPERRRKYSKRYSRSRSRSRSGSTSPSRSRSISPPSRSRYHRD